MSLMVLTLRITVPQIRGLGGQGGVVWEINIGEHALDFLSQIAFEGFNTNKLIDF